MASVVLRVVRIIFAISSFEFRQIKLLWLRRQVWLSPVHPTSIQWIITFAGNPEVLSQAATEVKKQFLSLKMH